MSSAKLSVDGTRKRKKKSSVGSNKRGHSKVKSQSRSHMDSAGSVGSTRSLKNSANRKRSKDKQKQKQQQQQHSRYATAHTAHTGYMNNNNNGYNKSKMNNNNNNKAKKLKNRNRPKNKIKSRNKAHRKAATTQNALQQETNNNYNNNNNNNNHNNHRKVATASNALSPNRSRQKRTLSNPRQFRHKFNMTEMQLVIGQISEMKKSWKTPKEEVMARIYEIIEMDERPHLNGKHCKVMLVLDDENYRVALLGNASEHVVAKNNLNIAFETENLYLLWESQQNTQKPKKRSTFHKKSNDNYSPNPPHSKPPNQDPDDMYTIQAFEHSFNETYEFRRYDFYCMATCIILGFICSGLGVFLYLNNDKKTDLYAIGAFSIIFAPILGILTGIYIGCIWYCCAVGRGKMDYYLGKNRFFGFQCKICDFCKYQYFIVVAVIGIIIIIISITSYLLFDEYIEINYNDNNNNNNNDNNNDDTNIVNTDDNGNININENKLFLGIEILSGIGGVGLFISGIIVYYCCINKKVKTQKGPSIHDDEFED